MLNLGLHRTTMTPPCPERDFPILPYGEVKPGMSPKVLNIARETEIEEFVLKSEH
jgi:hypothetical protein